MNSTLQMRAVNEELGLVFFYDRVLGLGSFGEFGFSISAGPMFDIVDDDPCYPGDTNHEHCLEAGRTLKPFTFYAADLDDPEATVR